MRSLLLEALLQETTTKQDSEKPGDRLEERITGVEARIASLATKEELRSEISRLEERFGTLTKWMIGLLVTIWATLLAAVIAALKILAG